MDNGGGGGGGGGDEDKDEDEGAVEDMKYESGAYFNRGDTQEPPLWW